MQEKGGGLGDPLKKSFQNVWKQQLETKHFKSGHWFSENFILRNNRISVLFGQAGLSA